MTTFRTISEAHEVAESVNCDVRIVRHPGSALFMMKSGDHLLDSAMSLDWALSAMFDRVEFSRRLRGAE